MSNKIETVSIGDLPIATELDDADELLLRDVSATLPENATARLSIATLRAAMGGGSPDRIESESGAAFAETTDDYQGFEHPGSIMGAESSDSYARVYTWAKSESSFASVWAGPERGSIGGVGFSALYNTASDEHTLAAIGAPLYVEEPVESNHAATKGYVDARPGAEEWSEHAAIQDVDLDGHKLTGLGEPTEDDDAATKGYVDGAPPPEKMQWDFGANGSVVIEKFSAGGGGGGLRILRQDRYRESNPESGFTQEILLPDNNGGPITLRSQHSGFSPSGTRVLIGNGSFSVESYGGVSNVNRARLDFDSGSVRVSGRDATPFRLMSESYPTLPAGVDATTHGIHLAKEAYDTLASMPAPPDLEWWEPVWTPVSNVDSVSNVECSYTRAYRAAGGSLVTLEGTITVTPNAAGQCAVQVDLPIARVGSGLLAGTAMAMEVTPPGHVVAVASVAETTLTLGFVAEGADPYLVGFRASYRAA